MKNQNNTKRVQTSNLTQRDGCIMPSQEETKRSSGISSFEMEYKLRVNLGNTIRDLRTGAGFTQEGLAFEAEVSRNTISTLESPSSVGDIKLGTFIRVCLALKVNPSDVLPALSDDDRYQAIHKITAALLSLSDKQLDRAADIIYLLVKGLKSSDE